MLLLSLGFFNEFASNFLGKNGEFVSLSVQGQVGSGIEQPDLVKAVPAHGR